MLRRTCRNTGARRSKNTWRAFYLIVCTLLVPMRPHPFANSPLTPQASPRRKMFKLISTLVIVTITFRDARAEVTPLVAKALRVQEEQRPLEASGLGSSLSGNGGGDEGDSLYEKCSWYDHCALSCAMRCGLPVSESTNTCIKR